MTRTTMHTPWGTPQDVEQLAEGVLRVSTAGHGGLKLSLGRWASLPRAVRDAMFHQTFAEEDCEEPIARTLLGIGDDRDREMAVRVAEHFERYAPALPYLRDYPPGLYYHVIAYLGGLASDPSERFDTGEQAEAFAGDAETAATPALLEGRGKDMTTTTRARPRSLPSMTTKLKTEMGNLYVTVSTDEDGEPFEVFGTLGKAGSFTTGVTELACRLISLHLRRGTPLEEIIDQIRGIQEMQPFANQLPDGASVWVLGLGDAIAHILKGFVQDPKQTKETHVGEEVESAGAKAAA